MTRARALAVAFTLVNLVVLLLFPPYDYRSIQFGNVPTFDGFLFALGHHPNHVLNGSFLALEIIVVLLNLAIAWLLIGRRAAASAGLKVNRAQRGLLVVVAMNLLLMLLFPPFENYLAISKAALPTFEGFYFIFGDNSQRQIVTTILYLEIMVVLVNAGLLWLLLRDKSEGEQESERLAALASEMARAQKRG